MLTHEENPRREFLGKLAGAAFGIPALLSSVNAMAQPSGGVADAEEWFKKVKGKHKIIYDAPDAHDGFPIIWSWVFYKTNNATGTPDTDMTAVVVLRHNAIPLAMQDGLWSKYGFGEIFSVTDPVTSAPAVKNPFYEPTADMWKNNGIEGIKALQARGVMFCVCDMAMTVYSARVGQKMNMKPEDVKKEWVDGLLPGMQAVPSGVWAIGRAQEKGCAYCFAGS